MAKKQKSYADRTDVEKINSQLTKINGLMSRKDWSAAVVRPATATEIALNSAIRKRYADLGLTDKDAVDGLLRWANGITGKLNGILIPALKGTVIHKEVKKLKQNIDPLNTKRNEIVHMGMFCDKKTANANITTAKNTVKSLAKLFEMEHGLRLSSQKRARRTKG